MDFDNPGADTAEFPGLFEPMPEVVLYYLPGSLCSQKVKLALIEASIDFTAKVVELAKCENYEEWYLKLNPKGVVPTLVVNGEPICDSAVIIQYIANRLCNHSNGFGTSRSRRRSSIARNPDGFTKMEFSMPEPATAQEAAKVQWDDAAEASTAHGLSVTAARNMIKHNSSEDVFATSVLNTMAVKDEAGTKIKSPSPCPPPRRGVGGGAKEAIAESADTQYSRMYSFTVLNHQLWPKRRVEGLIRLQDTLPMRAITFISLVPREKCVESLTKKLAVLNDKRQAHARAVKADWHDDSSNGAGDEDNNKTSSQALVILLDAKAADVHEWLTSCDVAKDGKERDQVIAKIALALDTLEARLFAGEEEELRWLAGRRYTVADVVWTIVLSRLRLCGLDTLWNAPGVANEGTARPRISAYFDQVQRRPSYCDEWGSFD